MLRSNFQTKQADSASAQEANHWHLGPHCPPANQSEIGINNKS